MSQKVENFTAIDQNGEVFDLYEALEKSAVLLYFYPKDMTSGCTVQAEGFRDIKDELYAANVRIVGVSKDSAASHTKFIEKHHLNFDLLADTQTELCQQFGCWVKKSMYGREYMGIERATFYINQDAVIMKEWRGVKPRLSAEQVTEFIQALSS